MLTLKRIFGVYVCVPSNKLKISWLALSRCCPEKSGKTTETVKLCTMDNLLGRDRVCLHLCHAQLSATDVGRLHKSRYSHFIFPQIRQSNDVIPPPLFFLSKNGKILVSSLRRSSAHHTKVFKGYLFGTLLQISQTSSCLLWWFSMIFSRLLQSLYVGITAIRHYSILTNPAPSFSFASICGPQQYAGFSLGMDGKRTLLRRKGGLFLEMTGALQWNALGQPLLHQFLFSGSTL